MLTWLAGIFTRRLFTVAAAAAIVFGMPPAVISAFAAVVPQFNLQQDPAFVMGFAYGIAAEPLGPIYVADTYSHRVIKYDHLGRAVKTWGSEGSAQQQFYYPKGVAVGINPSTGTNRIYVADTGNHRIAAYDDQGRFQFTFGEYGSGQGQLIYPEAIAVLPANTLGGTRDVCVTELGNARISCFSEQGVWKRSLYCHGCPGQGFIKPVGLAIRALPNGDYRYYVTDNYPGRIDVLDGNGHWIRSFGGPGESGELLFPDDLAVDQGDGSVYVTDTAFGIEQVSKFTSTGTFEYSFKSDGLNNFVSPHAITMDEQGAIYVVSSGSVTATKFKIESPALFAGDLLTVNRKYWIDTLGAWSRVAYNGVEQTCAGRGAAAITAAGQTWLIRTAASDITAKYDFTNVKMNLTVPQMSKIKAVWKTGGEIDVRVTFRATCQDGKRLTITDTFTK